MSAEGDLRRHDALFGHDDPSAMGGVSSRSLPAGLDLVVPRTLVRGASTTWIGLAPGDRPLVSAGQTVGPGTPIAERLRGPQLSEVSAGVAADAVPGARWRADEGYGHAHGRRGPSAVGELMFPVRGRWRVAISEHTDLVEAPANGIVREARPGIGILLELADRALPGALAVGSSSRGRLEIAAEADGELRAGNLDVGRSGAILALGSRVDAETLIRARAMGIRGVVVASMATKDVKDFEASEARLRASLHRPPAFAVLVLDGHVRRPIASSIMAILEALAGRETAIVVDPPMLVFDAPTSFPAPDTDRVRLRHGPAAGREGRWIGLAGLRRFDAGVHLDAAFVRFDDSTRPVVVPLADLERFC